jgi:probable rRNA maturation factor
VHFGREGRDRPSCLILYRIAKREGRQKPLVILEKQVAGLNEGALQRFIVRARKAVGLKGQVNVFVTSSSAVRLLNLRFRSQNKATDVLSFPAGSSVSQSRNRAKLAGEVAISADIALKNSFRLGHPAVQEVKILALHGILHLAGFDHERDNGEMARKEVELRHALGLPAGLIERVETKKVQRERVLAPGTRSSKARRGVKRATAARRMA